MARETLIRDAANSAFDDRLKKMELENRLRVEELKNIRLALLSENDQPKKKVIIAAVSIYSIL